MDAILRTRASSAPVTLLQVGSSVTIQLQEINGKFIAITIIIIGMYIMHALISYIIIVDETQVPPEDMDETYVEGFTHDETLQDQGVFKL